jgi:hypothetical protein
MNLINLLLSHQQQSRCHYTVLLIVFLSCYFHSSRVLGYRLCKKSPAFTRVFANKGFGGSNQKEKKARFTAEIPRASSNQVKVELSLDKQSKSPSQSLQLEKYSTTFNLSYPGLRVLSNDPPIFEIENFVSDADCDAYIALSQDPNVAVQVQSQTFSSLTATARTSTTWYVPFQVLLKFLLQTEQITGIPIEHYEEPQIVRYEMGQQFQSHLDTIPKALLTPQQGGQRRMTILVYLNTVSMGGATAFQTFNNLQVQPKKGHALIFFPADINGQPDERLWHAGQMTMETKWILQTWIHEKPYTAAQLPPNTSHSIARKLMNEIRD